MTTKRVGYSASNYVGNENQKVTLESSSIMVPVEQQSRYSKTIQTQAAIGVPASGANNSSWIDCTGFDRLGVTITNAVSGVTKADVYWSHDGATLHGLDKDVINVTSTLGAGETGVKAKYARITIVNGDSAATHVMSAWAYLKV